MKSNKKNSSISVSFNFMHFPLLLDAIMNVFPLKIGPKERTGAEDCASARCGMDAGCRHEPDGSWICICTHDLSPQRADGSCPRFVG